MSLPLAGRSPASTSSAPDPSLAAPNGAAPSEGRPGRARRLRVAGIAAILLTAAGGATLVELRSGSPAHAPAGTGVPPGDTTATLERRTLVERAQANGTLGYGVSFEVYDRLAGTFTWLPAAGAVIGRGGTLFKVNNLPVALMYGSIPAYRTLKEGISDGPDVGELNVNLVDLGFDPYGAIATGDHFSEATGAAVRRWQKADSLPRTGGIELGRIVFAPGARRVTAVHVALGEDPPGASSKKSKHPAAKKPASKKPTAKEPASEHREPVGSKQKQPPASREKQPSGSGEKQPSGSSEAAAAPKQVLATTATLQVVQLQVKATEQQLARVGESAPVTLPNGEVVRGHITNVGTVATESSENEKEKGGNGGGGNGASPNGSGENATISVTLALEHPVARLDKAPVSVELVKSIRRDVLAVPATSLVAAAGGGYAIEVLEGPRRSELAVTPGMFANGYVQIEGHGVHAGLTVLEPQ